MNLLRVNSLQRYPIGYSSDKLLYNRFFFWERMVVFVFPKCWHEDDGILCSSLVTMVINNFAHFFT